MLPTTNGHAALAKTPTLAELIERGNLATDSFAFTALASERLRGQLKQIISERDQTIKSLKRMLLRHFARAQSFAPKQRAG